MTGVEEEHVEDFGGTLRRVVRLALPRRGRSAWLLALAAVGVMPSAVGPWLLGRATDRVFDGFVGLRLPEGLTREQAADLAEAEGESTFADMLRSMDGVVPGAGIDFESVGRLLALVLAIQVIGAAAIWLQGWLVTTLVQNAVRTLRGDVEEKVHRLPLCYLDQQPRGELLSRVTNDVDNVGQTLQQTLSQLLTAVLGVVAMVAMMLWVSPLLTVIVLVGVPVSMAAAGWIMRRSQREFAAQWRRTGAFNALVEEVIDGHDVVNVSGRRRSVVAEIERRNEELYLASARAQFLSGLLMPMMMLVGNLAFVAIAVVGGLRVTHGAISVGDVQAFIQYSRQFTQPLTQIAEMGNILQSGVASAERVFGLLDADDAGTDADSARREPVSGKRARTAADLSRISGAVGFEHVWFGYDPDEPLFRDFTMTVEPGQTVAIVGPTGAGKTTLVNLILRFYEVQAGRITLDGVDTATMRWSDLRSHVGMVLQESWLFRGTIRDNIAYGRLGATDAEVRAAARATYVDRFVQSLPEGYDTVIEDDGGNLAAGERQLITIARAFLAQPALLILDEATSSVDTRTEQLLQRAMSVLRAGRTSFVIAHRLSTIRDADQIVVMERGSVIERGTYLELLERGGAFARLHAAQDPATASADRSRNIAEMRCEIARVDLP